MATFLYTRPSERLQGTITAQAGTEDTAYPAANLGNNKPHLPAKLTTGFGAWVTSLPVPTQCDLVALIHHNLDAGFTAFLQGHTSNAWSAPDLTQFFTIPPVYPDRFPVNVWLNLKALVPVAANRTKQYWRICFSGTNSVALSIGEWVMYRQRRDFGVRNIKKGSTRTLSRAVVMHETDSYVALDYSRGNTRRTVSCDLEATDATMADIETLFRDADGVVHPFLIVPYEDEADAWFVKFAEKDRPYQRANLNYNLASLKLIELSRGLYPTPAP